jgi:hypothetical protein
MASPILLDYLGDAASGSPNWRTPDEVDKSPEILHQSMSDGPSELAQGLASAE